MLTYSDSPTIRHAILRRLDKERGIEICEVQIHQAEDCIRVGVLATVDHAIEPYSCFDLPVSFELAHLHNEIDEIAEHYKAVRSAFWRHGRRLPKTTQFVNGSGLRGRWSHHGG